MNKFHSQNLHQTCLFFFVQPLVKFTLDSLRLTPCLTTNRSISTGKSRRGASVCEQLCSSQTTTQTCRTHAVAFQSQRSNLRLWWRSHISMEGLWILARTVNYGKHPHPLETECFCCFCICCCYGQKLMEIWFCCLRSEVMNSDFASKCFRGRDRGSGYCWGLTERRFCFQVSDLV